MKNVREYHAPRIVAMVAGISRVPGRTLYPPKSAAIALRSPKIQHTETGQAIFLPVGQARTLGSAGGTIHAMLVEVK